MRKTFKIVAFLEGSSYLLLLFIAVPIKYWGGDATWVRLLGMPHGILFILYILLALILKYPKPWNILARRLNLQINIDNVSMEFQRPYYIVWLQYFLLELLCDQI